MIFLVDEFPQHPKVAKAGGDAAWLFVCILGYCNRYLTGGYVPAAVIPQLSDRKQPTRLANRLADVELLERVEDGYLVHDYDDWNRTAEAKRQARSQKASKAAKARWAKERQAEELPLRTGSNGTRSGAPSNASSNASGTAPSMQRAMLGDAPHTGAGARSQPPTPNPNPDVGVSDPDSSSYRVAEHDDDDGRRDTLEGAWQVLARRALTERNAGVVARGGEAVPAGPRAEAWLKQAAEGERSAFEEVAGAYLGDDPTLTPERLAEMLSPALVLNGIGSIDDDLWQLAKQGAELEREQARVNDEWRTVTSRGGSR